MPRKNSGQNQSPSNNNTNTTTRVHRVKLFQESSDMYWSPLVQEHIQKQITHPNKIWVHQIINECKEKESIKLKTAEFILLPDTKDIYRKCFPCYKLSTWFNWMIIVTNPTLRNIRDLHNEHLPLLYEIKQQGIQRLQLEFPHIQPEDIMIYANYPPSIQQLHFHLCCHFFSTSAFDAFRIHPLDQIINNIQIHPNYYQVSSFVIPIHERSPISNLYRSLNDSTDILPSESHDPPIPIDSCRDEHGMLDEGT
jgi:hypothetical protein